MSSAVRFWGTAVLLLGLPLAAALVLWGYVWLGSHPPLVLIEAETGFVTYRVQREDLSSMALRGAEITDVAAICAEALDRDGRVAAVVRPPTGATVEYRWLPGMVLIRLMSDSDAPTVIENAEGTQCRVPTDLAFLVPAGAVARGGPLPVLGAGEIGVELGVPTLPRLPAPCTAPGLQGHCIDNGQREIPVDPASTSALHGATARLYGRTSVSGGQLYPISGGEFVIPGGSRLEAAEGGAPFIGAVYLDDGARALRVQVTTEAESLRLYRAGYRAQAELLATGSVARTISDPSLGPILVVTAIFVFLLQFALNVRSVYDHAMGKREEAE